MWPKAMERSRTNCTVNLSATTDRVHRASAIDCAAIPVPTRTGFSSQLHALFDNFPHGLALKLRRWNPLTLGQLDRWQPPRPGAGDAAAAAELSGDRCVRIRLQRIKIADIGPNLFRVACARDCASKSFRRKQERRAARFMYASTCCAMRLNVGAATVPPSCMPTGESSCTRIVIAGVLIGANPTKDAIRSCAE